MIGEGRKALTSKWEERKNCYRWRDVTRWQRDIVVLDCSIKNPLACSKSEQQVEQKSHIESNKDTTQNLFDFARSHIIIIIIIIYSSICTNLFPLISVCIERAYQILTTFNMYVFKRAFYKLTYKRLKKKISPIFGTFHFLRKRRQQKKSFFQN